MTEAVQFAGGLAARVLTQELSAGPVEGLRAFLAWWRGIVTASDFAAGCPVLAVSVEEPSDGATALAAAAEVFTRWESLLADSLRQHGAGAEEAEQVATLTVAAVEGAVAMCRAKRSAEPLDRVAASLEMVVSQAVAGR